MKPSEELMLLLELNGYDITKYKLKKQLEYQKQTKRMELVHKKKFQDLIMAYYQDNEIKDLYHKNPLAVKEDWLNEAHTINEFYVMHPEFDQEMTLNEFLKRDQFDPVLKESILYDCLDNWIEEYRETSIKQMENLRNMVELLPKKSRKYHKPSKIVLLFMISLTLGIILIYKNPEVITPDIAPFIGEFIKNINQLLYDVWWYSLVGVIAILFGLIYIVYNNAFSLFIRNVRSEKSKYAIKTFDKWENDIKQKRLHQSGLLEDYVDALMNDSSETTLQLESLQGPERLMTKFKQYVQSVEYKYDFMTKYYKKFMKYMHLSFFIAIFSITIFVGLGIAIIGGWIHVLS